MVFMPLSAGLDAQSPCRPFPLFLAAVDCAAVALDTVAEKAQRESFGGLK